MQVEETFLKGCYIINPVIHKDDRGIFYEAFNKKEFEEKIETSVNFVQDNHSVSSKGVLRGLHYQASPYEQAKLVRVTQGEALDVMVDLRKGSPTFGQHFKIRLSEKNRKMLFLPEGIAHGFIALQDNTNFIYKCGEFYKPQAERGIRFDDPELGIDWEYPLEKIILSEKDKSFPRFKEIVL